jgi:hypothetical protein
VDWQFVDWPVGAAGARGGGGPGEFWEEDKNWWGGGGGGGGEEEGFGGDMYSQDPKFTGDVYLLCVCVYVSR